ncbi:hypothetical protein IE81DRAFT_350584 [Ceraceosorus guamensis]|uniref:Uncharacterized protein n=1 Tax=Ceraceosorus guamensis TaxID=1522189 RepID=A0A316VRE4_9BASI|nr:hypothetical protein IE81DRAFT_350584 [Ceraceosorus guamensis]PWN38973.1 hypothetical protein IE81DRAFT_350584 [Ceraceosorus guamensis]
MPRSCSTIGVAVWIALAVLSNLALGRVNLWKVRTDPPYMTFEEERGNWTVTCETVVGYKAFWSEYAYHANDKATYCLCGHYYTNVDYGQRVIDILQPKFPEWTFNRAPISAPLPKKGPRPGKA